MATNGNQQKPMETNCKKTVKRYKQTMETNNKLMAINCLQWQSMEINGEHR